MTEQETAKKEAQKKVSESLENQPKDATQGDSESRDKRADAEAELRDIKTSEAGT